MSSLSHVKICNLAFRVTGIKAIASFESNNKLSPSQETAKLYFPTLEGLLAGRNWGFANCIAKLALVNVKNDTGWKYAYKTPIDMLNINFIAYDKNYEPKPPYQEMYDKKYKTTIIYTDRKDAKLNYTVNVKNSTVLPALFIEALKWQLAVNFAMSKNSNASLINRFAENFKVAMLNAVSQDAKKTKIIPRRVNVLNQVRMNRRNIDLSPIREKEYYYE